MTAGGPEEQSSVLGLLAPLSSTYVQRGSAAGASSAEAVAAEAGLTGEPSVRCSVEAAVTIDPKGRVCWPPSVSSPALVLGQGDGSMIDVRLGAEGDAGSRRLDGRGRLQLPQGLMRSAGMGPGDRVVIIRWAERDGFAVVSADALGVRRAVV